MCVYGWGFRLRVYGWGFRVGSLGFGVGIRD